MTSGTMDKDAAFFTICIFLVVLVRSAVHECRERARNQSKHRGQSQRTSDWPPFRRSKEPTGSHALASNLFLGSILLVSYWFGAWTFGFVGVSRSMNPALAFLIGVFLYPIVCILWIPVGWLSRNPIWWHHGTYLSLRSEWPRDIREKRLIVFATAFLNPVTEELVTRGILVFMFSEFLGSIWPPIILGVLLNLGVHAYQGTWTLIAHALFFTATIGVLYSPLGLIGCVGLHFVADLVPLVFFRNNMLAYKAARRSLRSP